MQKFKKRRLWLGLLVLSCFAVVTISLYALGPQYISLPSFDSFQDQPQVTRYRSQQPDSPYVFFIQEANFLIPDSSFPSEIELGDYLAAAITDQGWTDNSTLPTSWVSAFCSRLVTYSNFSEQNMKSYASNAFLESGGTNRWAAPHLCLLFKHDEQARQYEVTVATFNPTLISALTD